MLSNTAVPRYYGAFRDAVIRGDIPVCKEVAMEMYRIDRLIESPSYYYDDRAVEGWIEFCENELTLTDGSDLHLLDTFKLWGEQVFGWYYFDDRSVYVPNPDGRGGRYVTKRIKQRLTKKQYLIVGRGAAKSLYDSCIQAYFCVVDGSTTHQITTAPTMKQAEEIINPIKTAITRARELLVLVGDSLRTAGYTCIRTAATCAEARALFAAAAPELMILDINLPDGDGFTLLRQLHAKADVPALFLSARDADADRLLGLGLGADDYLTKPFLMQELLLRVQRILQRAYRAELCRAAPPALELGDCQVDLADAAVYRPDGVTLPLTATERALLQKLADNRGHIVTYDALCEAVWGADYYGCENALNVHIRHLREKLEENASRPQWLLTVRGIGYKLAGEVQR